MKWYRSWTKHIHKWEPSIQSQQTLCILSFTMFGSTAGPYHVVRLCLFVYLLGEKEAVFASPKSNEDMTTIVEAGLRWKCNEIAWEFCHSRHKGNRFASWNNWNKNVSHFIVWERLLFPSSAVIRRCCDGLRTGQWGVFFFQLFVKCSTFVPGISSAVCAEAAVVDSVHTMSSEMFIKVFIIANIKRSLQIVTPQEAGSICIHAVCVAMNCSGIYV